MIIRHYTNTRKRSKPKTHIIATWNQTSRTINTQNKIATDLTFETDTGQVFTLNRAEINWLFEKLNSPTG